MIVVITGASKGIGRALVHKFAESGNTLLVCSRGEIGLYELVQEVQNLFPDCNIKVYPADLSIEESIKAFAEWCLQIGTPDILINNAGKFLPGSIQSESDDTLKEMLNTNLLSAYHLTRALLPSMVAQRSGHIFNMCSIASLQAYSNGGSYSISKFALLGFSKNLREELKPLGIKVTSVIPGAVYTDSWAGSGVDEKRIMQATDIAEMVFAASQLSPEAVVEEIVLRPQLGDL